MAGQQSYEETKQDDFVGLGPQLGPVFTELRQEVAWLQAIWAEYLELFGSSRERVELLNASAGFFFHVVQKSMWHDILLRIRRITDPPQTMRNDNLTVMRLASLCPNSGLAARVDALAIHADSASKFAKTWRDKRIAHADLSLALGNAVQLPAASQADVTTAIASIHAVLNEISQELLNCEMCGEPIIGPNGAVSMLYVLRNGKEAHDAKLERIRSGTYTEDDIQRRPAL